MHRAQQVWQGIDRIWLSPDAQGVHYWYEDIGPFRIWQCLTHAATPNVISVIYVDEGRRLYPHVAGLKEWPNPISAGLYQQWLNVQPCGVPGHAVSLMAPTVKGDKIVYKRATLQVAPGSILPISHVDAQQRTTTMAWQPQGSHGVPPISPEVESKHFYGSPTWGQVRVNDHNIPVTVAENDPTIRGVNFWLQWPQPFDAFFPYGGGADLLYHHHTVMRQCVEMLARGERIQALREAEVWVNRLTGEGHAALQRAWLMPKIMANVEEALWAIKARFDLDVENLPALAASARFAEIKDRPIKVRRVHGWLGYLWWEFYQDLQDNAAISVCQHPKCGTIFRTHDKRQQYCKEPACVRRRANSRQRHHRGKGR